MESISWNEAYSLFGGRSLKEIREVNNINIPEEYNISVKRLMFAFGTYVLILGIFMGLALHNFL